MRKAAIVRNYRRSSIPARLRSWPLGRDPSIELLREPELLSPAEREKEALEALGLTPGYDQPELPTQVIQIAEYNRKRQAEIDERRTMRIPAEEPDQWTSVKPGASSPNAAATPSSSHPSRRSPPPTPFSSARPNQRLKPDTAVVHPGG